MSKNTKLWLVWALAVLFLLNCRTLGVAGTLWPTATPLPAHAPPATFTPFPTPPAPPTLATVPLPPTTTPRKVATAAKTKTRTALPPTVKITSPPPTVTTPPWEYIVDPAMRVEQAPNCDVVYLKGKVVDSLNNPVNSIAVELTFFDIRTVRVSGVGEKPGEFGFAPLDRSSFHSPITFVLRLVRSEKDHTAISEPLTINFADCNLAGQFTKIRFKRTR